MSFEERIEKLENIVKKLETPEMGMDEGIKLFADGVELSKKCYAELKKQKGQIIEIQKDLKTD